MQSELFGIRNRTAKSELRRWHVRFADQVCPTLGVLWFPPHANDGRLPVIGSELEKISRLWHGDIRVICHGLEHHLAGRGVRNHNRFVSENAKSNQRLQVVHPPLELPSKKECPGRAMGSLVDPLLKPVPITLRQVPLRMMLHRIGSRVHEHIGCTAPQQDRKNTNDNPLPYRMVIDGFRRSLLRLFSPVQHQLRAFVPLLFIPIVNPKAHIQN